MALDNQSVRVSSDRHRENAALASEWKRLSRAALGHAYRVAFTDAFTSILLIAAGVAFVGAVAGFGLVRTKDFVTTGPPASPAASPPEAERVSVPAG